MMPLPNEVTLAGAEETALPNVDVDTFSFFPVKPVAYIKCSSSVSRIGD